MAENKRSVLLYCDLIYTVEKLSDQNAGLLLKHYLRYVNDKNPEPPNDLIDLVFEPIKQQLKRDLKEWEKTKEGFSKGSKASAKKRSMLKLVEAGLSESTVNVTVTDTVTVNVNETFLKDLPNSIYTEATARDNKLSLDFTKSLIPIFQKSMDVKYETFTKFGMHFKRWVPIYLKKNPVKPLPIELK
jgi:hypothetical protein